MRVLIKLGGTLLDSPDSLHRLAREIASAGPEYEVAVVHGGGKQMTRFLAERGTESRFVNGLRVTTPEIIDAVVKVFAGSVNASLVSAFRAAGARPVGLSGISAGLVDAEVMDPELGLVGRPIHSDTGLVKLLIHEGYLPVIACIAGDQQGHIYNVNADQMAVACGVSFDAAIILFLTDVEGVRDGNGASCDVLTAEQARELIRTGVATGGMQAKLESALRALDSGVHKVVIAPGARPDAVALALRGAAVGTRLVA